MDVPPLGAILGGIGAVAVLVLADVLARWINGSVLDRITKLTDLRAEIATALLLYANLFTNPLSEETRGLLSESERKRVAEGREVFRKFAAELAGRRLAIQWYPLWEALHLVPRHAALEDASMRLIGLSNQLPPRTLEDSRINDQWRNELNQLLGVMRPPARQAR
jgi:hypothetical protein